MTPRIITITEEAPADRFWDSLSAFLVDEGGALLIVVFLAGAVIWTALTSPRSET